MDNSSGQPTESIWRTCSIPQGFATFPFAPYKRRTGQNKRILRFRLCILFICTTFTLFHS